LVTATPAAVDALLDSIEIDHGFVPLLQTCATNDIPVHIVSDGFDYCIERILRRPSLHLAPHLDGVQITSSHLEVDGSHWRVGFQSFGLGCVHGCATCKPAIMATRNPAGRSVVFVGDGLSDRYAAAHATFVFAKDKLAAYCDERAIVYRRYEHLGTVARQLDGLLHSDAERASQPT
jgi:2-hydroxy-3-keto-5-methylthiopentenyl-1-phosphate phosphatase